MKTEFSLAQLADPDIQEADKILRACVHCGFCTATCPTYVLLGDELDSPRGRIYLIKQMLEKDEKPRFQFVPHVIEPSAGADRFTLAVLCEAYSEDTVKDAKGKDETRTVMRFHPRLAPIKAAIFPLVNKDGMDDKAKELYRSLKPHFNVVYDQSGAIGRRYRRQDEAGTPFCITVDGDTLTAGSVTVRERDSCEQTRVGVSELASVLGARLGG